MQLNSPSLWLKNFPLLKAEDNKYDRGHAVVIGSELESGCSIGASKLSAIAALRSGAGLVTITSSAKTANVYAAALMSIMIKIIANDKEIKDFFKDQRIKSILIGPGNGVTASTKNRVLSFLSLKKNMVIDADAITVFQDHPNELFHAIKSKVVLTPHQGEFTRIFSLKEDKISSAMAAAKLSNATILLKGHDTIIASPDGRIVVNKNAPVYLATAGSGDVLSGIITGLMAQDIEAFEACCMAAYIHSKAAEKIGVGLISEDLLLEISHVIRELYLSIL